MGPDFLIYMFNRKSQTWRDQCKMVKTDKVIFEQMLHRHHRVLAAIGQLGVPLFEDELWAAVTHERVE